MRLTILVLPVIALSAACGGGEPKLEVPAATPDASAAASTTPAESAAEPSAASPAVAPAVTAAPVTGSIADVKMIGDAKGYRFEPAHITAKPGDGIRFVVVSGGPHEVAFDLDQVPQETRSQLIANMPNATNGHSPLLAVPREAWMVSLAGLKPGLYPFVSTPRLPQGMKGEIEIK